MLCLDDEALELLATGDSDDDESARMRAHVESCAACRDRLENVEANLSAVPIVRRTLGGGDDRAEVNGASHGSLAGFSILREIAPGGTSIVYEAVQSHPRRRVALKVLRPGHLTEATIRRFEHEANVLAELDHPGIARIYEAGVADGVRIDGGGEPLPYVAMELIDGVRLDAFVRTRVPPLRERLELLAAIADAVQHAHVKGLMHRDLKPANILIVERDGKARPRIVDFGVARPVELDRESLGQSDVGRLVGTLPYMSPEQIAGDPARVDARCDVYALGVIMFEVLAGRLPFAIDHCSLVEAARVIREAEPERLGRIVPELRGDVEAIAAKAIARMPEQRYQSAAEFAADIRRFLSSEPVEARRIGPIAQLARYARRNRALMSGVGAVIAALVIGLGAAVWQAGVAFRARDEAERRLSEALAQADYLMNEVVRDMSRVLGAEDLQYEIARQVSAFFERIGPGHPDNLAVRKGWWESLRLLAAFEASRGDAGESRRLMQRSHAMVEQAFTAFPDDADVRFQHAYSLRYLAISTGTLPDGTGDPVALLGRSALQLGALVRDHPDDHAYRREYAAGLRTLAKFERVDGRFDDAARHLAEARAQYDALASTNATVDHQRGLAITAHEEGLVAGLQGRAGDARAFLEEALQRLQDLVAEDPDDARLIDLEAGVTRGLARLCFAEHRYDDALGYAARSVELYERLDEASVEDVRYRPVLTSLSALQARIAAALGRTEDASAFEQRTSDRREPPGD